ncbi:unnamed protein product, partial [Musa hybrid cultivar]
RDGWRHGGRHLLFGSPRVRSPPSSVVFFLHASPSSMLVRPNHYEKYTATGLGRTTPEEHRFEAGYQT